MAEARTKDGGMRGARRSISFSPTEILQIEKMAYIGMRPKMIAYILGCKPAQLKDAIRRDRDALREGRKLKATSVYLAVQRGRAQGDAILMRTAFESAIGRQPVLHRDTGQVIVPGTAPNTTMLIHLLKTRLGEAGGGEVPAGSEAALPPVIFETQIGDDGIIRQTTLPLLEAAATYEDDEGNDPWLK